MRRVVLCLAAVAVLAAPAVAEAAVRTVAPAKAFRRQVRAMERFTDLPVLLPARIAIDVPARHGIEARWSSHPSSWELSLGIGPRCGGANACFVGLFAAERGGTPAFRRRVRLRHGIVGRFKPTTCGASCSPPEIQWVRRGVLYEIQFRAAGPGSDLRKLVAMAKSAIASGQR